MNIASFYGLAISAITQVELHEHVHRAHRGAVRQEEHRAARLALCYEQILWREDTWQFGKWFRPSGTHWQARCDAPPHAALHRVLLATKYGLDVREQHQIGLQTRVVRLIWQMGVRVRRDSLFR